MVASLAILLVFPVATGVTTPVVSVPVVLLAIAGVNSLVLAFSVTDVAGRKEMRSDF